MDKSILFQIYATFWMFLLTYWAILAIYIIKLFIGMIIVYLPIS